MKSPIFRIKHAGWSGELKLPAAHLIEPGVSRCQGNHITPIHRIS
jgi:hypothetical protein